jgi:hypothetical protein
MKRILIMACVAALALVASTAFAGTQDFAVLALHAGTHFVKGDTPCDWGSVACSDFTTEWPQLSSANLYLVIARGEADPGIAALSCGVEYGPNLACYSFTLCTSGLQFPNDGGNGEWPASLGGNRITWNAVTDCKRTVYGTDGVHALAGSFYVYAYGPDLFQITENRNLLSGPELQVGDCSNSISDLPLTAAGAIGFAGTEGYNPCTDGTPVSQTTWGKVKTQY